MLSQRAKRLSGGLVAVGCAAALLASFGGPSAAATTTATSPAMSRTDLLAESYVVNAMTAEMAYYTSSSKFSAAAEKLDPAVPWSKHVEKGHVAVHVGCTSRHGDPKTFLASSVCDHGKPQAVVLQSEASKGGACYSVIADETAMAGREWYNFEKSCPKARPSGPPLAGRATSEGKGWYTSF
jgi:hypothetical protein